MNLWLRCLNLAGLVALLLTPATALALPPADDLPEEILRREIITAARSPLTGEPISAADYAVIEEELSGSNREPAPAPPDLAQLIFLLQIRRVVKPILPFIP